MLVVTIRHLTNNLGHFSQHTESLSQWLQSTPLTSLIALSRISCQNTRYQPRWPLGKLFPRIEFCLDRLHVQ
jgi:hypothetical protein